MGEVFKGWRRKLGAVMLLLACISMSAWLRGQTSGNDLVEWKIDNTAKYVVGLPPAGYWLTRQRTKIFRFKNGGSTSAREYEWIVVVPYWCVTGPLTLLSAWLLISKPRKKRRPILQPLGSISVGRT